MSHRNRTRWRPKKGPALHRNRYPVKSTKYSRVKPVPKSNEIPSTDSSNKKLFEYKLDGTEYLRFSQSKKQLINMLTKQKQIVFGYIRFMSHLIPQVISDLIVKYYNERIDIFLVTGSTRCRFPSLNGIEYLDLIHQQRAPLHIYSTDDFPVKSTQNSNWDNSRNSLLSFIPNITLHADTYEKYRHTFNHMQFDTYSSSQFSCIIKANIKIGQLSMILFPNTLHENSYNKSLEAVEIPLNMRPVSTTKLKSRCMAIKKADRHLICMFASQHLYECKVRDTERIIFDTLGEGTMNYMHHMGGNMCYIGSNGLFISGPSHAEIYHVYTDEYEDISDKVPQRINFINDSAMFWDQQKEFLYVGGGKELLHNKVQFWNMHKNQWFELPDCGNSHFENPLLFSFNHSPSIICIAGNYASNIGVVEYFDFRVHRLQWLTAPNDLQLMFWRNKVNDCRYSRIRSLFM